jgi:hypothetical protein
VHQDLEPVVRCSAVHRTHVRPEGRGDDTKIPAAAM